MRCGANVTICAVEDFFATARVSYLGRIARLLTLASLGVFYASVLRAQYLARPSPYP